MPFHFDYLMDETNENKYTKRKTGRRSARENRVRKRKAEIKQVRFKQTNIYI